MKACRTCLACSAVLCAWLIAESREARAEDDWLLRSGASKVQNHSRLLYQSTGDSLRDSIGTGETVDSDIRWPNASASWVTACSNASVFRGQDPSDSTPIGALGGNERGVITRSADVGSPHPLDEPNIEEPGPDSADFPDSAFTVKPGVVYIETSVTTESSKGVRIHDYFTNTLIRVGVRENWELRISSPGVIQEVGPGIDTTGFGPLTFGFKRHVWDEDGWVPAFGIITQVKTPLPPPASTMGLPSQPCFSTSTRGYPTNSILSGTLGSLGSKAKTATVSFRVMSSGRWDTRSHSTWKDSSTAF